jgi:hypothetical protein
MNVTNNPDLHCLCCGCIVSVKAIMLYYHDTRGSSVCQICAEKIGIPYRTKGICGARESELVIAAECGNHRN